MLKIDLKMIPNLFQKKKKNDPKFKTCKVHSRLICFVNSPLNMYIKKNKLYFKLSICGSFKSNPIIKIFLNKA